MSLFIRAERGCRHPLCQALSLSLFLSLSLSLFLSLSLALSHIREFKTRSALSLSRARTTPIRRPVDRWVRDSDRCVTRIRVIRICDSDGCRGGGRNHPHPWTRRSISPRQCTRAPSIPALSLSPLLPVPLSSL